MTKRLDPKHYTHTRTPKAQPVALPPPPTGRDLDALIERLAAALFATELRVGDDAITLDAALMAAVAARFPHLYAPRRRLALAQREAVGRVLRELGVPVPGAFFGEPARNRHLVTADEPETRPVAHRALDRDEPVTLAEAWPEPEPVAPALPPPPRPGGARPRGRPVIRIRASDYGLRSARWDKDGRLILPDDDEEFEAIRTAAHVHKVPLRALALATGYSTSQIALIVDGRPLKYRTRRLAR